MINSTLLFHRISYLQYPFMLVGFWYIIKPYTYVFQDIKANLNLMLADYQMALIFIGMAMSFSTLQDTTKMQNNFSRKVWENPTKGKFFIAMLTSVMIFCFTLGIVGMYLSSNSILNELAFGLIVFAIGILGVLKAAIELFENHRLDKNPITVNNIK